MSTCLHVCVTMHHYVVCICTCTCLHASGGTPKNCADFHEYTLLHWQVPTSAHNISTSSDSVALIHSFAPLENCPSHNGTLSNSDTYRIGSETYRHNTTDSTDVNATKKQPSLAESGQGYGALENREGDSAETTHKVRSSEYHCRSIIESDVHIHFNIQGIAISHSILASIPGLLPPPTIDRMTFDPHSYSSRCTVLFNGGSKVIRSITHTRRGEPRD